MNNWLEYFPENVLERGYSYHLHGFVRHLNYKQVFVRNSFWHGRL